MEEGVGLQCKIAEVNVKESEGSNEGVRSKQSRVQSNLES